MGTAQGCGACVRSGDGPKQVGGKAECVSRGRAQGQSGLGARDGRGALRSHHIKGQVTTSIEVWTGVALCVGG